MTTNHGEDSSNSIRCSHRTNENVFVKLSVKSAPVRILFTHTHWYVHRVSIIQTDAKTDTSQSDTKSDNSKPDTKSDDFKPDAKSDATSDTKLDAKPSASGAEAPAAVEDIGTVQEEGSCSKDDSDDEEIKILFDKQVTLFEKQGSNYAVSTCSCSLTNATLISCPDGIVFITTF